MEKKLNSYFGMAYSDYLYAQAGMAVGGKYGDYNGVASICAQSAEKYLKAILEQCTIDEQTISFLHSHNLRSIVNRIKESHPELALSSKDMKWIGHFYYDARYPGDHFIKVNEEDALECLRIVEELGEMTEDFLNKAEEERMKKKEKIKRLPEFFF